MSVICISKIDEFFQVLQQSELLDAQQLKKWKSRNDLPNEAKLLAKQMVVEGDITLFQGNQLLQGRHRGFRLGDYTILNLLSEGSKDAVYLAKHHTMNRRVAIKVIKLNEANCESTRQRFFREARITALLDHANIVKVFDFIDENGQHCLVMEYVEGTKLREMIDRQGHLPYKEALDYIRQAALGLQHAHDQGIIHRNINPSNLLRDGHNIVKILDMGHSRFTDDDVMNVTKLYTAQSMVGSVDYIAPEQVLGDKLDARCDIYSLGATLYALLAGRPPFQGNSLQVMMAHQVEKAPAISSSQQNMPAVVNTIIDKMMAKQPDDRYQSCLELIDAVDAVLKPATQKKASPKSTARKTVPPLPPAAVQRTPSKPQKLELVIEPVREKPKPNRMPLYIIGAAMAGLLGAVLVVYFMTK
jgi:serine/threonine protein kinase